MVYRFDEIAVNSTAKKKPVESDKFHYIGLEHIDSGSFEITRWGSEIAPVGEKLIMKKGDVLFGKRRAYQRKVAISPIDGIFSAHGMVLRPKEDVICKEFFPFFISSNQFMDTAIRISVGGLSPTINWKDLQKQEFELPSLEEQRVLADKLWAAYKLKEAYKKMIAAIDEMVKSQFIEMFGKITETRSLCEICRPKQWPTIQTKDFTEDGYLVYGANGIIGHYSVYNHEFPTILMACRGASCGAINISQPYSYITGNAMCMDDIIPEVALEYLSYYLSNYDYKTIITGGAQPQITYANLKKVIVSIPPYEEQLKFVSIYNQADKSKFVGFKSQFIEMFGNPLGNQQMYPLKRLADCCDINPRRSHITLKDSEYVSFVPMPSVSEDGHLQNVADEEYGKVKKGFTYFENNDVLFAKITPCMENGKGAVATNLTNGIGMGSTEFHVLRPIDGVSNSYWLLCLTRMKIFRKLAEKNMSGTGGQKRVGVAFLENFMIGLPPIDKQNAFESIYKQADKSKYIS